MQSNYSIAFCGTSLSWYFYYQPPLVAMLQAATGRFIRPMGHGVNGSDSSGGLTRIAQIALDHPDFAILEYSMNDCAHMSRASAIANTTSMLNTLKTVMPASRIFLMTMNPSTDVSRATLTDFYADYRTLAVSQGVGLIDCYPSWLTYGYGVSKIPDGIHPTQAAAQDVTTQAIYDTLLPLIV